MIFGPRVLWLMSAAFAIQGCKPKRSQTVITHNPVGKQADHIRSLCNPERLNQVIPSVKPLQLVASDQYQGQISVKANPDQCAPGEKILVSLEGPGSSWLWRVCDRQNTCFPSEAYKELAVSDDQGGLWFRSVDERQYLPFFDHGSADDLLSIEVRPCSANFSNCHEKALTKPYKPLQNRCPDAHAASVRMLTNELIIHQQNILRLGSEIQKTSCRFHQQNPPVQSDQLKEWRLIHKIAGNICNLDENYTQSLLLHQEINGMNAQTQSLALSEAPQKACPSASPPAQPNPVSGQGPVQTISSSVADDESLKRLESVYEKFEKIQIKVDESGQQSVSGPSEAEQESSAKETSDVQDEDKKPEDDRERKRNNFIADLLVGVGVSFIFTGIPVSYFAIADKIKIRSKEKVFNDTINEIVQNYKHNDSMDAKTYLALRDSISDEAWFFRQHSGLDFNFRLKEILPKEPPKNLSALNQALTEKHAMIKGPSGDYKVELSRHGKAIEYTKVGGGIAMIVAGVAMTVMAWDHFKLTETSSGTLSGNRYLEWLQSVHATVLKLKDQMASDEAALIEALSQRQ